MSWLVWLCHQNRIPFFVLSSFFSQQSKNRRHLFAVLPPCLGLNKPLWSWWRSRRCDLQGVCCRRFEKWTMNADGSHCIGATTCNPVICCNNTNKFKHWFQYYKMVRIWMMMTVSWVADVRKRNDVEFSEWLPIMFQYGNATLFELAMKKRASGKDMDQEQDEINQERTNNIQAVVDCVELLVERRNKKIRNFWLIFCVVDVMVHLYSQIWFVLLLVATPFGH